MTGSIFGIGVSGLNAAQAGLLVTGHNISNATTDGFHRQQAIQDTQFPQATGSGFFGKGVNVVNVKRAHDQFLTMQAAAAKSVAASADARYSQLTQLENIFPPIPSELIMPLAGFTAAQGELSFVGAVAAGIAGSVLGQLPLYYLGRLAGGVFEDGLPGEVVVTRLDGGHGELRSRRPHVQRPGAGVRLGRVLEEFELGEQRLDAALVGRRDHLAREDARDAARTQQRQAGE